MCHKSILTQHHRKPRSKGGTNNPKNISMVEQHQHEYWHALFSNMDAEEIAELINNIWLDPSKIFMCLDR